MFSDLVFVLLLGLTRGPGAKPWVTAYLSMASIGRNGTTLLRLGRIAAGEENRVAPVESCTSAARGQSRTRGVPTVGKSR